MNEYEIGKDVQDLRSRLERLETESGRRPRGGLGAPGIASQRHVVSGGLSDAPPIHWKLGPKEQIPPFAASLLRLSFPPPRQFDSPPLSETWGCTPDPLTPVVYWDGGGQDNFYTFSGQYFSKVKWTDPGTGKEWATVTYSANLTASGRAHTDFAAWGSNTNSIAITVRLVSGAPLFTYTTSFKVDCHENSYFTAHTDFNPGEYDLVGGATWVLQFDHIARCP